MTALTAAAILSFARAADEKEAILRMPWGVILMVTGVTVLIELLEKTQGLDLFTDLLVRLSTTDSVTAVVAFVTGVVSSTAARLAWCCLHFSQPFRASSSGSADSIRLPSRRR